MNLKHFDWSANDLSRKFQGSKTQERFIEKFLELLGDQSSRDEAMSTSDEVVISQPPKKRVKVSGKVAQSHQALMPVSRSSGESLNQSINPAQSGDDENGQFDQVAMDKLIHNHFKGWYYYSDVMIKHDSMH